MTDVTDDGEGYVVEQLRFMAERARRDAERHRYNADQRRAAVAADIEMAERDDRDAADLERAADTLAALATTTSDETAPPT